MKTIWVHPPASKAKEPHSGSLSRRQADSLTAVNVSTVGPGIMIFQAKEILMNTSLLDQVRSQSAALVQTTSREVRKHPVASAAIAVAAVGLISYLASQAVRSSHNGRS